MALIKCPECGKNVSDKATSCPECGFPVIDFLKQKVKKCPECGTEVPNDAVTCLECGYPLQNIEESRDFDFLGDNRREMSSEFNSQDEYDTTDSKQGNSYTTVIDSIITCIKVVSIVWIVVGIFQLGVVIYEGYLLDRLTGDIPKEIAFYGLIAIANIVGGILRLYREPRFRKNPLIIYNTFKLTVPDVIIYVWNFVCCWWLFSARGLFSLVGLMVLAAILTDILGIKVKIGNNKSMFLRLAEEKNIKESEERELSANDDDLPGDYWTCPKCEGPIKRYPCKYCGYKVIDNDDSDMFLRL